MTVFGYRLKPLLKATGREMLDDGVPDLAAGAAYNFFLAIFPLLLFLAPVLSLIGEKEQMMLGFLDSVRGTLPPSAVDLFQRVLDDVVFAEGAPGLMSLGALGALWAGSNVFAVLTSCLNNAFDVEEDRPWWKRRLMAVIVAAATGGIMLFVTVVIVGGEKLASAVGISPEYLGTFTVLQFPAAALILVGLAWMNFTVLPNIRVKWQHALAGAVFTVILWMIVTVIFRMYVQHFGRFNATYGTIGGVIVLLMWMYLSMIALLMGGELASELHQGTGAVKASSAVRDARSGRLFGDHSAVGTSTERTIRLDPLSSP
jgi:membrane protein